MASELTNLRDENSQKTPIKKACYHLQSREIDASHDRTAVSLTKAPDLCQADMNVIITVRRNTGLTSSECNRGSGRRPWCYRERKRLKGQTPSVDAICSKTTRSVGGCHFQGSRIIFRCVPGSAIDPKKWVLMNA